MKHNRKTAFILALSLTAASAACGQQKTGQVSSADIELIEPVNTASNTETVTYRNLYDYKVVSGFVYPDIQEYAFSVDARLQEYCVLPGDAVKKGTPLVRADENTLMDEIEQMRKSMDQAQTDYLERQQAFDEELEDLYEKIGDLEKQREDLEEEKGKIPNVPDTPQMREWRQSLVDYFNDALWDVDYRMESYQMLVNQNRLEAAQAAQLYELDAAYNEQKLEELIRKKDRYTIFSGIDGTVISLGEKREGDYIGKDEPVIAVAGSSQKIIRCEYIKQSEVDKCEDLYAVINGVRYEVTYQPYTTGEYNRLSSQNGTVYSSFLVDDPQDQVKYGDFAVLLQMISDTGQVLTVPKNAIHWDERGYFVYCVKDGESEPVYIRTGKSDGVYTQVTSGLEGGEVVLLTDNNQYGTSSTELKRGDFYNTFSGSGYVDYPSVAVVRNPVKNGTTYLLQMCVDNLASVRKGDVIADIRVAGDEITLYEKQIELERMNERLVEVVLERAQKQAEYDRKYAQRDPDKEEKSSEREERQAAEKALAELDKDLERRRKEIDELTEEIQKLQNDYAAKQICTGVNGRIYWVKDFARNNILSPDEVIAYVAETDRSLLAVSDEKHQLILGSTVTVEYKDNAGKTYTAEGTVVTAAQTAISKSLVSDTTYIQVPQEIVDDIVQAEFGTAGYYMRVSVSAVTREMRDVVLVPHKAVHVINGKMYVFIKKEDGSIVAQSFIPGGYNNDCYWVLEGLEEGMIVCSE